jgi:hypothetical protein
VDAAHVQLHNGREESSGSTSATAAASVETASGRTSGDCITAIPGRHFFFPFFFFFFSFGDSKNPPIVLTLFLFGFRGRGHTKDHTDDTKSISNDVMS